MTRHFLLHIIFLEFLLPLSVTCQSIDSPKFEIDIVGYDICYEAILKVRVFSKPKVSSNSVFNVSVVNTSTNQAINLSSTYLDGLLLIPLSTSITQGNYRLTVSTADLTSTKPFYVKPKNEITVSGFYNVLYSEDVKINYTADNINDVDYSYYYFGDTYSNYLNSNDRSMVIKSPHVSGTFPLSQFYRNGCNYPVSGQVQINVLPSIIIDSLSKSQICMGDTLFLYAHSNVELKTWYSYILREGHEIYNAPYFHREYTDGFRDHSLTYLGNNKFQFVFTQSSTVATLEETYLSIKTNGIEGIISREPFKFSKVPDLQLRNTTYNLPQNGFCNVYFTSNHDKSGFIELNDGETYKLEKDTFSNLLSSGRTRIFTPGNYESFSAIKVWNSCGLGIVSGNFNVNIQDASKPAIKLKQFLKKGYCVGDTLWIDWETHGIFGAGNQFYVEFSGNKRKYINSGDEYTILTRDLLLDVGRSANFVRLKSTNPALTTDTNIITQYFSPYLSLDEGFRIGEFNATSQFYFPVNTTDSILVNPNTELVVNGIDGFNYLTDLGHQFSTSSTVRFDVDTTLHFTKVQNFCGTASIDRTIKIFKEETTFEKLESVSLCNGTDNFVIVNYHAIGNQTPFLNTAFGLSERYTANSAEIEKTILFNQRHTAVVRLEDSDFVSGNRFFKFRIKQKNNSNENNKKLSIYFSHYRGLNPENVKLTSNYGNDTTLNVYPITDLRLTLDRNVNDGSAIDVVLNNGTLLGYDIAVSQPTNYYLTSARGICGFMDIKDTISIKYNPQFTQLASFVAPCKNSANPLRVSLGQYGAFPASNQFTFFLKSRSNGVEYGIWQTSTFSSSYNIALPDSVPVGQFTLGYQSSSPVATKYFPDNINIVNSAFGRILSGTVDIYEGDLLNIPFELNDGNNQYIIETNATQETFDPILGTIKNSIYASQDGYNLLTQGQMFGNGRYDSLYITNLSTINSQCQSAFEGVLYLNFLPNSGAKFYAQTADNGTSIIHYCNNSATDIIVQLNVFSGGFGSNNIFVPQLSDSMGKNYQDITTYAVNGLFYTISLPSNLTFGEGYRLRFRSTSPALFGASTVKPLIIRQVPLLTFDNPVKIREGQNVNVLFNYTGAFPWRLELDNMLIEENIQSSYTSLNFSPLVSTNYRITKVADPFCENTDLGSLAIVVSCVENKNLSGLQVYDQFVRAESINSTSLIGNNLRVNYNAGKTIVLDPGFSINESTTFTAEIKGCEE
jgi:hypothetical protein